MPPERRPRWVIWIGSLPPVRRRLLVWTLFVTVCGGYYLLAVFVPVWLGLHGPHWDAPAGAMIGAVVGTVGVTWW